MLPLSEIKSRSDFHLYIDVSIKNGAHFSSKPRPTLILRKLEYVDIFQNDILKKWQSALDAPPEMTGGASRKAGPIRRPAKKRIKLRKVEFRQPLQIRT